MNPLKPTILDFYEFIYDRQQLWYNRFVNKLEPEYWTDNPILKKNRFCNVYRELDACTKHLIKNITSNKHLSFEDKIFNILIYRRFNTPDWFDVYGIQSCEHFHWKMLEKKMDEQKARGNKLFNSAYIICQRFYNDKYRKGAKHVQQLLMMNQLRKAFVGDWIRIEEGGNLEALHEYLVETIPMTGGFLAQQYWIDMLYIPGMKKVWDVNSFVDVGPGARPGIDLLFPRKKEAGSSYADCCKVLFDSQKIMFDKLKIRTGKDWNDIYYKYSTFGGKYLCLTDIQNCLCEFRKMCMLQTNPNKRKRYYKPEGAE